MFSGNTKNWNGIVKKLGIVVYAFFLIILPVFVKGNYLTINRGSSYEPTITSKYYCPINLSVKSNYVNAEYSEVEFNILFNSLNETLAGSVPLTYFSTGKIVVDGNTLHGEAENSNNSTNQTQIVANLTLTPIGKSSTQLDFRASGGNLFDVNDPTLNINGDGRTATGALGLTINYEACPCTDDGQGPTWGSLWWTGSNGKQEKNGMKRALGTLTLAGLVNDRNTSSVWHTGFDSDEKTLDHYNHYNGNDMDNQVGVNKNSITMKIVYSGAYGSQQDQSLKFNSGLTIGDHEGNGSKYTWNHNIRGYNITGSTAVSLQVEKPVTVKIYAKDLGLNGGNVCRFNPNGNDTTPIATYTFNTGSDPWITVDSKSNVNPDATVSFVVSDDWAGVNTGTVVLRIADVTGSNNEIIWTGGAYSGEKDLSFSCGSRELFGGTGSLSCTVTLKKHLDFPTSTTMRLSGYVKDYLGRIGTKPWTLTTRKDCSEITGCYNPLVVNLWSGVISEWIPALDRAYTGTNVVVTGTVAPYPYLTGDSGNILMCGPIDAAVALTGIKIYDTDRNEISSYEYSQTGLYITGLDYTYQSQSDEMGEYGGIVITK